MNSKVYNSVKATIFQKDTCVTVFGNTAKLINAIAITAAVFVATALIVKAIDR